MKLRALVVLGIAAFTFAACSKCGGGGSTSGTASGVERVLPKGAVGVVVVPSLEQLGQKLKLVQGFKVVSFVGQLRGFNDGQQLGDALVNELGIDVRSTEALAKAGIDGARSAGVGALITGHGYLALPVKNEKDFHARSTVPHGRIVTDDSRSLSRGAFAARFFSRTLHQRETPR